MQVVSVASDLMHPGFTGFLKPSCEFFKMDFMVLEYDGPFFSNRLKDALLEQYLADIPDDEIVLFTDATDTAFMTGENEILNKFYKFNAPLVFSAEINCWPDSTLAQQYPATTNHFNYLNSGGFIGRAGFIKELYQQYPVFGAANNPHYAWSNQYYWNTIFIKEPQFIKIDHNCEIFYNTSIKLDDVNDFKRRLHFPAEIEAMVISEKLRLDDEIYFEKYRLKSNLTNSTPCHIHFPGPISKILMEQGYFDALKQWKI